MSTRSFLSWVGALSLSIIVVFIVLPLTLVFSLSLAASHFAPKDIKGPHDISVVELSGVILDSREVVDTLYQEADDPQVKGIVLRVNSPGGAIGPAQEIFTAVKKIRETKPVVASMGSIAASGGLYAALGADKIYCQPGTLTGSIGVIMQIPNVKKISDLIGFQMNTVKSGALKDVGNVFREMTPKEEAYLQETIDAAYGQFVEAVAESRNLKPDFVRTFADGRIILGSEAVKLGLADDFGDIDSAARAVFDILKEPIPAGKRPRLYYPMDEFTWVKKYLSATSKISDLLAGGAKLQYLMQ